MDFSGMLIVLLHYSNKLLLLLGLIQFFGRIKQIHMIHFYAFCPDSK